MKLTRKRSAGNPHAAFDVAGAGNVLEDFSGAPVLDPTRAILVYTMVLELYFKGG